MEATKWREWQSVVPLVSLLSIVIIYCLSIPQLYLFQPWSMEVFKSSISNADVEPGHGPVTNPVQESNDFSLRLSPEDHRHRGPQVRSLEWNVMKDLRQPDGVAKCVYVINDQFPGPTVEGRCGDELQITVNNLLDEGEDVAIHWHGLHVSNDMDGVPGLTQCAIAPNRSFLYRLIIDDDQAGTFWYHFHLGGQRSDGLFGALVVHKPDKLSNDAQLHDYDEDQVLMIGDWYHRSAPDVLDYYKDSIAFEVEPAPDSLLLNGQGFFDCSQALPIRPVNCTRANSPHLALPAGRTRLRIINTGALTGFTLSMIGYKMTLITLDGGNEVKPVGPVESIGMLYPGERMDIVVERLHSAMYETAWISVALDRESMQYPNLALTPVQQFLISPSLGKGFGRKRTLPPRAERSVSAGSLDITSTSGVKQSEKGKLDSAVDETILLYITVSYLAEYDNRPKGMINNTFWRILTDAISLPLLALEHDAWPRDQTPFVSSVVRGSSVDIVVNNLDDRGHPFHLHGHEFYVLASHKASRTATYELYNPYDTHIKPAGGPLNAMDPIKKDTVFVPPLGYVVLRFEARNEGLWQFHCNVLWHQAVGISMAVQIGEVDETLKTSARESCKMYKHDEIDDSDTG